MVKANSGAQAVLREIPASVPAQLGNQMSLPRLVHVARKLTPGEPPAEDILAVNAYSAMLKQKATCDYEERFHA